MPAPEREITLHVEPHPDVALERAFAMLERDDPPAERTLRDAVWSYVDDARGRGEPPERVIVDIKELAHRAGVFSSRVSVLTGRPQSSADAVMQRAVTWCIQRYYAVEEAPRTQ